ncbi:RIP metalloprotease RseP [Nitrospirillum sp. BR 11828]|uniref:RIP metalloprotease RseP n=1 Tax=Nitrospirillum sp. BR 11828 TaxID=3104325 RepID=UPI002ACA2A0E|nr:RIP metalloprotease RseP [Nitrospirillum sp. BR 11828]MDZ5647807.1 RIP metalloprotease RseP [Nitrospirillum sp. BR 11828]
MHQIVNYASTYGGTFLVVLTVLVFVHEFGHYYVARRNGVRVEVFSIGFGPEIWGFNDRAGTRWKFSVIPLGGYVKMFGDADAASRPGAETRAMTPEERAVSFHHKRVGQRAAIVVAGPMANFLFAIVALSMLFMFYGQPYTPAVVQQVEPDSAAAAAGLQAGDRVLELGGHKIERFEDLQQIIAVNPGVTLDVTVQRGDAQLGLKVTPRAVESEDRFGNKSRIGRLGVVRGQDEYHRRDPLNAVWAAAKATWALVVGTLDAVGQMIAGTHGTEDLGGPLRIVQMSGEMAQLGLVQVIWFMTVLSVNLGLINLFPVPMLDGGHLMYYGLEALRGRPLGERAQEYGFRIGLALVLSLMIFATWNDLIHFGVGSFVKSLISKV